MQAKRFYRSSQNKKICGVCGGIGEYFGVDPTLIRILTLVMFILGHSWSSFVVIAYFIVALCAPLDRDNDF